MARDNVLFHASIPSGAAAGTVIPLSLQYGIENVRAGYGTPVLKNVRAIYSGCYSVSVNPIAVEIKNSKWIDSAGMYAQKTNEGYSLSRNSLAFMRGRDKELTPNTSWTVNATIGVQTTVAGDIYVLFEIEYTDVPAKPKTDDLKGSPVLKKCINPSATVAANVPTSIGVFDNLLQDTQYVLSEMAYFSQGGTADATACTFAIVEGFSNQRGLIRIIPIHGYGMAEPIEGSVVLTKQTYSIGLISSAAISATNVEIDMELVASAN